MSHSQLQVLLLLTVYLCIVIMKIKGENVSERMRSIIESHHL